MRLRTILTIVFCMSALAPMIFFWLWPNSSILQTEKSSISGYHVLVARNLAAEIGRYYGEKREVFSVVARNAVLVDGYRPGRDALQSSGLENICVVNPDNGRVTEVLARNLKSCPERYSSDDLTRFKKLLSEAGMKAVALPFPNEPGERAEFGFVIEVAGRLVTGRLGPEFVAAAGQRIIFGERGRALILDRSGKLLSHPNQEWQDTSKNISENPFIREVLSGEAGVGTYQSEFFNVETVAGYAHVQGPGWAVVVFQPTSELESKINNMRYESLSALGMGMVVAICLAFVATKILTFPILQMVQAMERIGNGELRAYENMKEGWLQTQEFSKARDGIKAMAEKLRENIDTISQHAYLDGITGLPNRECFKVLAQEEIERLGITGQRGALLFLDLDGFKQVNDVYGHRSGDDLLKGFANKIHIYCGNEMKRRASGVDNAVTILPARLGGDEFVIFLANIRDVSTVMEFANGLFHRVFGKFKLHNGVTIQVNGSVGGALFPDHGSNFDELLRLADIAMYQAKNAGKGRFCLHREVDEFAANEANLAYGVESELAG